MTLLPLAFSLHTTPGIGWTLLGAVLLAGLAIWSYRWTRPPKPVWVRAILAALRLLALLAVWLLATGFELRWQEERPRQSRITLLLDRSESMSFSDASGDRWKQVQGVLEHPLWEEVEPHTDLKALAFGENTAPFDRTNSPAPDAAVTDLAQALRTLAQDPAGAPDAVVLISDGAVNRGGSPESGARRLGAPVFAVAVGDSIAPKDAVIAAVDAPERTYVGEKAVLEATLRTAQMQGERVQVRVQDAAGNLVAQDTVQVRSAYEETVLRFPVTPTAGGLQHYHVEALPLEGETDTGNNRRRATVRVEERKRRVLLIAGAPSSDAGFLIQSLEENEDTEVEVVLGGGPGGALLRGGIPSSPNTKEYDATVILPFPTVSPSIRNLITTVAATELPVVLVTGARPDHQSMVSMAPRFGGLDGARGRENVIPIPATRHPVLTLDGSWFEESDVPPPPLILPPYAPMGGLMVATTDAGDRPVVVVSQTPPRTLAWFAGNLWKWDLGRRPIDPGGNGYDALWDRTLRWVTARPEAQTVVFEPDRPLFTGGEEILLRARVRDEAMRPLDSLEVAAEVSHDGETRTVLLAGQGDGLYRATVTPWGAGAYSAEARIAVTQQDAVTREAQFVVDEFSLEAVERRMRIDRLRALAQATSGAVIMPAQMDTLADLLPKKPGTEVVRGAWRPFGLGWVLLLVAFVLGLEWFIRTRTGMV